MKKQFVLTLAACTLIGWVATAKAAEAAGGGVETCSYFLDNYKKDSATEEFFFAWAQGYMSGLNIARLNDEDGGFKSITTERQKEHIRQFCAANPDRLYFYAVIDLYTALYPKKKCPKGEK